MTRPTKVQGNADSSIFWSARPSTRNPDVIEQEHLRLDAEIAVIDARIAELELDRVALKRRKNILAPISQLSHDVLGNIFHEIQSLEFDTDNDEEDGAARPQSPQLPWIRAVTHVCSRWRELALATPTLWTNIQLGRISLVSEMLRRSNSAPLSITIPEKGTNIPFPHETKQVLREHLHRTKFLDLRLPPSWYEFLNTILRSNITPDTLQSCSFSTGVLGVDLPIDILVHSTHSLRFLNLDMCFFRLRSLNTSISFSCLSQLQLTGPATRCADFLDFVSLPLACSVTVDFWDRTWDFSVLHPFIRGFWESRVVHYISVGTQVTPGGRIDDQMVLKDNDPTRGSLTTRISSRTGPPIDVTGTFIRFLSLIPIHRTTSLSVGTKLDKSFWTFINDSCRDIMDLDFSSGDLNTFFETFHVRDQVPILKTQDGLILDPSVDLAALATPFRFPKVTHITFHDALLLKEKLELLKECLLVRQLVGKQIHSLTFKNMLGLTAPQADAFSPYIKEKVSWSYPSYLDTDPEDGLDGTEEKSSDDSEEE
ncbi:hypothetical protein BDN72DRAFT_957413 [Pluteus cervinus]|uniref:Uncharacterized protein n=1 Tax=Pluteus cervinus TaxID=181527 RepID=A0ACD3B386_9AGAR|nr:hypothetical protein BDN72DRAFT_957413 [Pluteus cervinus]